MRKLSFFKASLTISLATLAFAACDSGDIYEPTAETQSTASRVVKLTADISGLSSLPEKYALSLAAFKSNDRYATKLQTIAEEGPITVLMSNTDNGVSTVELAITDRLRHRVLTLAAADYSGSAEDIDTIRLEVGRIDVSQFNCLQQAVFNKACIQCHGGNGRKAGSLDLTDGHALAELVDKASATREGAIRVVSGNAEQSLLHQILQDGGQNVLHYNHVEVLSSQFKENLEEVKKYIDDWINGL